METFKQLSNLHFTNMLNKLGDDAIIKIPVFNEETQLIEYEDLNIKCLFENPYYLVQNDYTSNLGIETEKPKLVCKAEDVKNVKLNYEVIIDTSHYRIIAFQPDGLGVMNVLLHRV